MREADTTPANGSDGRRVTGRINDAIHSIVDRGAYCANFVLAVLMVLMAASHVFDVIRGIAEPHVTSFIGYIALISCGLAIIFDRKRNLPRSVGLYAIGLGFYRTFTALPHLVPHSSLNLFYFVIIALGLNMALSGRAYLMGRSRARITMMGGSIAFLLLAVILLVYMYSETTDAFYVLSTQPNTVLLALMYFTYILILDSEKLRKLDWLEIHNCSMDKIRHTYCLDRNACISRSDAESLAKGMTTAEGWNAVRDGGPVESEICVRISDDSGESYLTAQRWKGSDAIHATVTDHRSGTILQASRFAITDIEMCDGTMTIVASDGNMIPVRIEEGPGDVQR